MHAFGSVVGVGVAKLDALLMSKATGDIPQNVNFAVSLDTLSEFLTKNKGPSPKTGQLGNRGGQFYLAMYWAQELAAQTQDKQLQDHFTPLAKALAENEQKILEEFRAVQGKPVDIGGYFMPDRKKVTDVMRPSATFNALLAGKP